MPEIPAQSSADFLWILWILVPVAVLWGANWLFQEYFARIIAGVFDRDAPFRPRSAEPVVGAETWQVQTADGLTLQMSCIATSAVCDGDPPVVLFCPEYGASRWTASHYAAGLLRSGFDVLTFDFRNQGESDSSKSYVPTHWLTDFELIDLRAILEWVEKSETYRERLVGMMGISRGGCAALCVAAERPSIQRVFVEGVYTINAITMLFVDRWARLHAPPILLACVPRWHVFSTVRRALRRIQGTRGCRFVNLEGRLQRLNDRKMQFVSGGRDSYVPLEVIEQVVDGCGQDRSNLWRVPGAKHNQARDVDPDGFDKRAIELFSDRPQNVNPDDRA